MMVEPSVTELSKIINNRFELVVAVSRRARQLHCGAEQLTKVKEESVVTLASTEVAEGKVTIC